MKESEILLNTSYILRTKKVCHFQSTCRICYVKIIRNFFLFFPLENEKIENNFEIQT